MSKSFPRVQDFEKEYLLNAARNWSDEVEYPWSFVGKGEVASLKTSCASFRSPIAAEKKKDLNIANRVPGGCLLNSASIPSTVWDPQASSPAYGLNVPEPIGA